MHKSAVNYLICLEAMLPGPSLISARDHTSTGGYGKFLISTGFTASANLKSKIRL